MSRRLEVRLDDVDLTEEQVAELEEAIGRALREVVAGWGGNAPAALGDEAAAPRVEAADGSWTGYKVA